VTKANITNVVFPPNGPCPVSIRVIGFIESKGYGEVKYGFVSSDGRAWPEHTVKFDSAGVHEVNEPGWELKAPGQQWVQMKTTSADGKVLLSPQSTFEVRCPSE
jgi:hypothetical protein